MGFFTKVGRQIKQLKQKAGAVIKGETNIDSEVDDESAVQKTEQNTDVNDPRRNTNEGHEEVDTTEVALADEPGEAVGPDPEQAQPTQTEETEPDLSPEEDVSHIKANIPDENKNDRGNEE